MTIPDPLSLIAYLRTDPGSRILKPYWLILLSTLGLGWITGASAQGRSECAITYVANAGVLFETDGQKFLFDAPIREGIAPYATPTMEQRRSLESATAPFDNVTAILITHWHGDHFSAEAVAAHLRSSPSTRLVSSAEVVQRVKAVADLRFQRHSSMR